MKRGKRKKSPPSIETLQVLVKGRRKLNPQNSFTNTKHFIKDQHEYLIIAIQSNITRQIRLRRFKEQNIIKSATKSTVNDHDGVSKRQLLGCGSWWCTRLGG
jgi:hypothetical protein